MDVAGENSSKENPENVQPENNEEKMATPPPQGGTKKSKKEEKKKEDKSLEQLMKSLNSLPTIEEKFSMVCKKHVQSSEDLKKLQFYVKQSDKRYAMLLKEKEQLQHEFNKTILVKSKLENLCRELQKQNKAIKEESLLKIREEEERRKETQSKFQNTLSDITTLLQQNNEKNAKLRDDNISMSEKFKSVVQQYQLREQQVDKMSKQMALESQLSDAKLQKCNLEHQAERERMIAEMEQLKVTVAQYRAKVSELQGTETALRGTLGLYTDKYDEFQNALSKSNQVFVGFKEQMEMMSKKIKKLEKESLSWKKKWETSQTALLDMCSERQVSDERSAASARQLHHMQSLCRTLQGERTLLLNTLKENNIERPPLPPLPAMPPPPPSNNDKVDAMAANCAQLRQSLAHLQTQLNVLTNNKNANANANSNSNSNATPEVQEPPKQDKPKKSKSKKSKAEKLAQKAAQEKAEEKIVSDGIEETNETNAKDAGPTTNGEETETKDSPIEEKVDDQTLETLIQAINSANINLCDLEVINDNGDIDNIDELDIKVTIDENPVIQNSKPKIIEITDDKINDLAVADTKLPSGEVLDEVQHIPEVKPIAGDSS